LTANRWEWKIHFRSRCANEIRATLSKRKPSMKWVYGYRGRLLIGAVLLIILLGGGVATYRMTRHKPSTKNYGEGTVSLPTLNGLTNDTYEQVTSDPERYQGDEITWPCKVEGFYGTDSGGNTGIACNVYDPSGDFRRYEGEILILASPDVGISTVKTGEDITLDGYVDEPYTGKNAQCVDYAWPEISASVITDHGPRPTPAMVSTPTR
jgi:hypothetical protein